MQGDQWTIDWDQALLLGLHSSLLAEYAVCLRQSHLELEILVLVFSAVTASFQTDVCVPSMCTLVISLIICSLKAF